MQATVQVIDRRMSRMHAEVILQGPRSELRDLESKNGTYLNEKKVEGTVPLNPGDRIRIGDTIFFFEWEGAGGAGGAGKGLNGESTTARNLRVVDEKQWGRMAVQVRAGADPHLAVRVDASEGEILKDSHRRLEILYQVADAIRSILDTGELLEKIMDIIFSVIQPDRGYILITDTGRLEDMTPKVLKRRDGQQETEITLSSSIVQRCIQDRSGLLVTDAASDQRFSASESIVLNRIRSAMVTPLIFKNEVLGVIYVDTQSRIMSYSREELELLTGIANQSATAIINARLHSQLVEQHKLAREMEIARSIQMNLLPKRYPGLPGYEISAMSLPAKQVGGDYYDFYELGEGRTGFAIADVSGKGVPAAFLTALARTYLRSGSASANESVANMLSRVNTQIYADVTNNMYVTAVFGLLESATGKFRYVNAGHAYPLLFKPGGSRPVELDKGGTFLGILEEIEYEESEVTLQPGDVLVLYTDGVTDIHNESMTPWGRENLDNTVRRMITYSAEEIRNAIYETCQGFKGDADQFDDFTLIVLKRSSDSELEID